MGGAAKAHRAQGGRRGGAAAHDAPTLVLRELTLCLVQGLLLDLDVATLTVWVNGKQKGVAVKPGMTNEDGAPVGRLEGPLRWVADLAGPSGSIAIAGPLPLPPGVDREDAHGTADMEEDPQRDEEDEEGDDHAAQATTTRGAQRRAAAAINAANPDASSAHGAIDLSGDD